MPRLWTRIAGSLGLLTLAVLVFNAGVFWVVLEQAAVKRQTDLAASLGQAMGAQLGAAVRKGADPDDLAAAVAAVGEGRLDMEQLVLVDTELNVVVAAAGEAPGRRHPGVRAALFAKTDHLEIEGSVLGERIVRVTVPVVGRGQPVGVLQLGMRLQPIEVPGGALGFALLYVLACGGVIALFGWAQLRTSLVGPIERLRTGTGRIAGGELGHQLGEENTAELQALVTSLNAMSAGLKTAQDALIRSERLAGVGRMAAGLAHEVGNPLAAIMATVDLLSTPGAVSDDQRAGLLAGAREELDRIDRIIQSLLGSARSSDGRVEQLDLDASIRAAIATVDHQPDFQDVRVDVASGSSALQVSMSPDRLHQVLINLLHNAADAPGVERIEFQLSRTEDGAVQLRCIDDGAGFSPVALERAFEPFFTTKDVGAGTGLGLSTCMAVIGQAGGTIEVSNTPESGACVQIRWPSSLS